MSHRRCCCDPEPQPCPTWIGACDVCPDTFTVTVGPGTLTVNTSFPPCVYEFEAQTYVIVRQTAPGSSNCVWQTETETFCPDDELVVSFVSGFPSCENLTFPIGIILTCTDGEWRMSVTVFASFSGLPCGAGGPNFNFFSRINTTNCPPTGQYPYDSPGITTWMSSDTVVELS